MFYIEKGINIYITRGDKLPLSISMLNQDKTPYLFQADEVIGFKVIEKENMANVLVDKRFTIEEETEVVDIDLLSEDTRIGDLINEPEEYWYEIELNPDTPDTNTIIGYDQKKGAPLFVLLPEGGKKNDNG